MCFKKSIVWLGYSIPVLNGTVIVQIYFTVPFILVVFYSIDLRINKVIKRLWNSIELTELHIENSCK